jgi:hypothetical protein
LCEICDNTDHLTDKCPILKQPQLLAHPCGYDASGLGFYHIPNAPINIEKNENRTTLVTVQGGVLTIPQLVAELSRLISERWNWQVTQHDNQSFVVPFPSRGDLQRSVAFGQANIKEHKVCLLFEEWKHEEERIPLQRVWIRIYRLPQKLREFLVLWALGSMLDATQSVDMITSLQKDYGRVEVAVLNVDLLPSNIDTVVIEDRLYSLPILVESHEDLEANDAHMEVDDGNNGAGPSEEKNNEESSDVMAAQGKEKRNTSKGVAQDSSKKAEEPLEEMEVIHEEVLDKVKNDIEFLIGNSNLNATQESHAFYDNDQNTNEPKILPSPHAGLGGVHGTVLGS